MAGLGGSDPVQRAFVDAHAFQCGWCTPGFVLTVRALLEKKLQYVNDALKDDQWICGSRFTIADAYLFTVLRWARAVKLNMDGLDHIASYMARVAERPAVAAALKAEGLN